MRIKAGLILFVLLLATFGSWGFLSMDMSREHSPLCALLNVGACPPSDNIVRVFSHNALMMKVLNNVILVNIQKNVAVFSLLILFAVYLLIKIKILSAGVIFRTQYLKWKEKIFLLLRQKFLYWISLHNKSDESSIFGLLTFIRA